MLKTLLIKYLRDGEASGRKWLAVTMIAVVAGYALYVLFFMSPDEGLETFFRQLEENGYTANRNFSGLYFPGNVIQIMEKIAPDGKPQQLHPPLVFLWHTDCFPNKAPNEKSFTPPESLKSKNMGSLQLKSSLFSELFPLLQIDSDAVAAYSLVLQNQRLLAYARADLNRRFSDKCYDDLFKAINEEGDQEDWFAVIYEAVVADSLKLEMQWKTTASAKSRAGVTAKAKKKLADTARDIAPRSGHFDVVVALESENEKKTVIQAKGLVILGYRTRPIEVRPFDKKALQP